MNATAIIVSAGKGERIGGKLQKQFIKINDIPVICHTISIFDKLPVIDGIVLVVPKDRVNYCKMLVKKYGFKKVINIVPGGQTRSRSVYNGLKSLFQRQKAADKNKIIVIHDGVRPFVSKEVITNVIAGAARYGSAISGLPVKSTIKETKNSWVTRTVSREKLSEIQTPQAFSYEILKKCFEKNTEKIDKATDTSYLVEKTGYKVRIIDGNHNNIKITTKEDLDIARGLAAGRETRVGIGYDIHRLVKNRKLVLGGINIKSKLGLLGHSDADVLLHSITDAILGALGERDIGWFFPDTDKRNKNKNSSKFVRSAREKADNMEYAVMNIDNIIVAQYPRLSPYYDKMIANISKLLGIAKNRVTVKFTTAEEMGPLGNKEAVASISLVTLAKKK